MVPGTCTTLIATIDLYWQSNEKRLLKHSIIVFCKFILLFSKAVAMVTVGKTLWVLFIFADQGTHFTFAVGSSGRRLPSPLTPIWDLKSYLAFLLRRKAR